jgi:hypothetical protein
MAQIAVKGIFQNGVAIPKEKHQFENNMEVLIVSMGRKVKQNGKAKRKSFYKVMDSLIGSLEGSGTMSETYEEKLYGRKK